MANGEIEALQRSVKRLKLGLTAMGGGLVLILTTGLAAPQDSLIRTKGIVVEDAEGRARILIGAPAPAVEERLRTNLARQQEAFGWIYPEAAMQPARRLNNDTFGILILDKDGHDRVALGAPVPDPLNGKRIGPAAGLTIHDDDGIERGGLGHIKDKAKKLDRVGLGLDGRDGEGAGLTVDRDGTSGLFVNDNQDGRRLFNGVIPVGSILTPKSTERRLGSLVSEKDGQERFRPAAQ